MTHNVRAFRNGRNRHDVDMMVIGVSCNVERGVGERVCDAPESVKQD